MKNTSLFCLAIFATCPAWAHDPAFIQAQAIHAETILPSPPAVDSQTTRDELAVLHRIQSTRTSAQIAQAQSDEKLRTMFIYRNVLGEKFDPADLPLTAAFARRVKNDASIRTGPIKKMFHRVRPYQFDKTLSPVCKTSTKDNSYPSEHSTAAYLNALVLIEMVPERRDAIFARADEYVHNRLICGVHYPGDVQAGRLLAYSIHAEMDANPQFQKELAAARIELRRALRLPAADN